VAKANALNVFKLTLATLGKEATTFQSPVLNWLWNG
jgi:hypothetical protein